VLTAKGNFQASQTAKARLGLPCAVTPRRDEAVIPLLKQLALGRAKSATEEMRNERNHCANEQKVDEP